MTVLAILHSGNVNQPSPEHRSITSIPGFTPMADKSSGEVEFVLFALDDGLWLGLGSDHTDRKAETVGVTLSKQLCGKPVGPQLWSYADVEGHWDELVLRSWATIDGKRVLYQESPVSSLRTPRDLIRRYANADMLPAGTLMFCGTPGAIGGIRPGTRFEMELSDPVLKRSLTHSYDVEVLPVIS